MRADRSRSATSPIVSADPAYGAGVARALGLKVPEFAK
jgi:hypothetical protein